MRSDTPLPKAQKLSAKPLLIGFAAYLPLVFEAAWLKLHWNALAVRWPQHWDAAGHVNGWGERTAAGVYGPLVLGAVAVSLLMLVTMLIRFAPGPEPAQRLRIFAPLAWMTWCIGATFAFVGCFPLLAQHGARLLLGGVAISALALLSCAGWLVVRAVGGAQGMSASASQDRERPLWRAGIFYYNPADAALLVPKRTGWGWTFNFARPMAWVVLLLILGLASVPALVLLWH